MTQNEVYMKTKSYLSKIIDFSYPWPPKTRKFLKIVICYFTMLQYKRLILTQVIGKQSSIISNTTPHFVAFVELVAYIA